MAAPDVGDQRSRLQAILDAVEGGDPRGGQVGHVARPEEPLGAHEQIVVVLVPADPAARPEGGPHRVLVLVHG